MGIFPGEDNAGSGPRIYLRYGLQKEPYVIPFGVLLGDALKGGISCNGVAGKGWRKRGWGVHCSRSP